MTDPNHGTLIVGDAVLILAGTYKGMQATVVDVKPSGLLKCPVRVRLESGITIMYSAVNLELAGVDL